MSEERQPRVPPGQYVTEDFPVLHVGSIPPFDRQRWDLKIWGLVRHPLCHGLEQAGHSLERGLSARIPALGPA